MSKKLCLESLLETSRLKLPSDQWLTVMAVSDVLWSRDLALLWGGGATREDESPHDWSFYRRKKKEAQIKLIRTSLTGRLSLMRRRDAFPQSGRRLFACAACIPPTRVTDSLDAWHRRQLWGLGPPRSTTGSPAGFSPLPVKLWLAEAGLTVECMKKVLEDK